MGDILALYNTGNAANPLVNTLSYNKSGHVLYHYNLNEDVDRCTPGTGSFKNSAPATRFRAGELSDYDGEIKEVKFDRAAEAGWEYKQEGPSEKAPLEVTLSGFCPQRVLLESDLGITGKNWAGAGFSNTEGELEISHGMGAENHLDVKFKKLDVQGQSYKTIAEQNEVVITFVDGSTETIYFNNSEYDANYIYIPVTVDTNTYSGAAENAV